MMIIRNVSKKYKIIMFIVVLLIVARIALPYLALQYANKKLANMRTIYGHIDDIDIALYRGAFKIKDIYLNKKDSVTAKQTKFFKSEVIDMSIEWSALLKGRLVREVVLDRPFLIFTKNKTELKDIQKDSVDLKSLTNSLPLNLNKIEVKEGVIKYVDKTSKPQVDIQMDNMYASIQNISAVVDSALLPSTIYATADVYHGKLLFNMKLNTLKDNPTFDLNINVENLKLPALNKFLQAYANIDVNKGTFGLYSELAAKDGKFVGYVKPIIKDLDVVGIEDKKDSFWQKAWEGIISAAGFVLSNSKKDQIATKLPLSGTFEKSDSYTWSAVINLLRNAFVEALKPSIDAEINIHSVDHQKDKVRKKGFLNKIFASTEQVTKKV